MGARDAGMRERQLLPSGEIAAIPHSKLPEGGVYGRNLACIDVLGDYRENIVTFDRKRHTLMLLVNPNVIESRGYSPNDDFYYRHGPQSI